MSFFPRMGTTVSHELLAATRQLLALPSHPGVLGPRDPGPSRSWVSGCVEGGAPRPRGPTTPLALPSPHIPPRGMWFQGGTVSGVYDPDLGIITYVVIIPRSGGYCHRYSIVIGTGGSQVRYVTRAREGPRFGMLHARVRVHDGVAVGCAVRSRVPDHQHHRIILPPHTQESCIPAPNAQESCLTAPPRPVKL